MMGVMKEVNKKQAQSQAVHIEFQNQLMAIRRRRKFWGKVAGKLPRRCRARMIRVLDRKEREQMEALGRARHQMVGRIYKAR